MTEANQERLYKHFVEKGMKKEAEMILKAYPHFAKQSQDKNKVKTKK